MITPVRLIIFITLALTIALGQRTPINDTISRPVCGYDLQFFSKSAFSIAARGTCARKRTVLYFLTDHFRPRETMQCVGSISEVIRREKSPLLHGRHRLGAHRGKVVPSSKGERIR